MAYDYPHSQASFVTVNLYQHKIPTNYKLLMINTKQNLNLTLKIWRQQNSRSKGRFEIYKLSDVSTESSFLEMLTC